MSADKNTGDYHLSFKETVLEEKSSDSERVKVKQIDISDKDSESAPKTKSVNPRRKYMKPQVTFEVDMVSETNE